MKDGNDVDRLRCGSSVLLTQSFLTLDKMDTYWIPPHAGLWVLTVGNYADTSRILLSESAMYVDICEMSLGSTDHVK